ncbi:MAG TPA: glycosyltransferase family 2 protein [Burkholderiales bacterium]|nr:glycosyltransferase family 2 protein [Burkholderiales bacterium]
MSAGHAAPPVLLLAFNRPDTTAQVLDAIRAGRPRQLFFAVDGPRDDRPDERGQVAAVRALADTIGWDCEVRTLFRDRNLGCKLAVSQAVSWFFKQVELGIVLEDDCVAHPAFFRFTGELLQKYADDSRVAMISGDNFQFGRRRSEFSYYFSRYPHIWGWASWRRAWQWYDHSMSRWPQLRDSGWLHELLGDHAAAAYWTRIFDETHADRNASWAYRWTFAVWAHDGLSTLPGVNLVSNIGFGGGATHNRNRWNRFAALPLEEMRFPLVHPDNVVIDDEADRFTQRTMFRRPWWRALAGNLLRAMRR